MIQFTMLGLMHTPSMTRVATIKKKFRIILPLLHLQKTFNVMKIIFRHIPLKVFIYSHYKTQCSDPIIFIFFCLRNQILVTLKVIYFTYMIACLRFNSNYCVVKRNTVIQMINNLNVIGKTISHLE